MYKIKTMNHISPYGLQKLEERGCVVGEDIQAPDGLILRSADLHSYAFEPSLIAIARSGAGTNNIPLEDCCRRGIVVFNSPGANAEAVRSRSSAHSYSRRAMCSAALTGSRGSTAGARTSPRSLKRANRSLQAPSLWARRWASSASARSARSSPTLP
ncbi:MAG: hypothetical protein ACLSHG_02445 [Oscillospiraceae bacterium]